jgi:hypothetical protein
VGRLGMVINCSEGSGLATDELIIRPRSPAA